MSPSGARNSPWARACHSARTTSCFRTQNGDSKDAFDAPTCARLLCLNQARQRTPSQTHNHCGGRDARGAVLDACSRYATPNRVAAGQFNTLYDLRACALAHYSSKECTASPAASQSYRAIRGAAVHGSGAPCEWRECASARTRRIRLRNACALNGLAARLALFTVGRKIARTVTLAMQREGVAVDCSNVPAGRGRVPASAARQGRST